MGENPQAADTAGVNVARVRYTALAISGVLMGLGGAFLSLAQLGTATFGIVAGRGWVAIAIVIFGNWQPEKVLLGALLFGGVEALQLRLRAIGLQVPYQLLLSLPHLATIVALALAERNASYPAALLKPYKREERGEEEAFFNEPLIVAADVLHSSQEVRFFALGQTDAGRLLFLAFTVRNQMMRVISARDLSRRERKVYQHAQSEAASEQGEDAEV